MNEGKKTVTGEGNAARVNTAYAHERQYDAAWYGAYDSEGKLRATFDSESEAYFYVRNRGHMHGGTSKPIVASVNNAGKLAEALRGLLECTSGSFYRAQQNAKAALAAWEAGQ